MTLFAASSWPFVVLFVLPVLFSLLFLAFRFSQNQRQRVVNMLVGVLGLVGGFAVMGYWVVPLDRRLEDFGAILIPLAMAVGAAVSIGLSAMIRRGLSHMTRQSCRSDRTE